MRNESENYSVVSSSLRSHGQYSPWNSPGQNPGVGSLSLLQGIFPTQGSNPGLPHCGQILYQLSHKGSPRILEWVDYPFSRGSSRPRNRTEVSCMAGESPAMIKNHLKIERDMCTPVFITALFIIARTWKQPRCPSADEWMRKLWYLPMQETPQLSAYSALM